MKWIFVTECLYRKVRGGTIYIRVSERVRGKRKRVMRSTKTKEPVRAKAFLERWRAEKLAERHNTVLNGTQVRDRILRVGRLFDQYVAAGHPARGRIGRTKSASTVERERRFLCPLREWWSDKNAHDVTLADCDQYREWRNNGGWTTR